MQAAEGTANTHQQAIFNVVKAAFGGGDDGHGSARALCGDTSLTLTAAAAAPAAGVRRMVSETAFFACHL